MKRVLGTTEIARRLEVSRQCVNDLIQAGHLPVFRLGTRYRMDADKLERWIEDGGSMARDRKAADES